MRNSLLTVATTTLAGALLIGQSALAQDTARDNTQRDPSIYVFGENATEQERRAEVLDYVRRTGVASGNTIMARWREPVCPNVVGLSAEHGALVVAQVRAVAAQVGAPVAAANCDPNINIVFTEDARETVSEVRSRRSSQFVEVRRTDRDELYNGTAPIRWWYRTETLNDRGLRDARTEPVFVTSERPGQNLNGNNFRSEYRSSLIQTNDIRAITSASVLIDINEAHGFTLSSVTDYAAMVALTEMRANDGPHPRSILGLFETADRDGDLTPRDRAFLTRVYDMPADRNALRQRSILVRALLEETDAALDTEINSTGANEPNYWW